MAWCKRPLYLERYKGAGPGLSIHAGGAFVLDSASSGVLGKGSWSGAGSEAKARFPLLTLVLSPALTQEAF